MKVFQGFVLAVVCSFSSLGAEEEKPAAEVLRTYFGNIGPEVRSWKGQEEFARWLVGTKWEEDATEGNFFHIIAPEVLMSWGKDGEAVCWRSVVVADGVVKIPYKAQSWSGDKFLVKKNGLTATKRMGDGRTREFTLVSREMPESLGLGDLGKMDMQIFTEWLTKQNITSPGKKVDLRFTADGKVTGAYDFGTTDYEIVVPGLVVIRGRGHDNWWRRPVLRFDSDLRGGELITLYDTGRMIIDPIDGGMAGAAGMAVADAGNLDLGQLENVRLHRPTANIQALLLSPLGNSLYAAQAAKLAISAVQTNNQEPATVTFNQPVGDMMSGAMEEVIRFHTLRRQGWPKGAQIELAFAEKYSGKDGPSAAVACALLLESLLSEFKIRPNFAVTGDLNADGTVQPIGGVASKLRGATKSKMDLVAVPFSNRTSVLDLVILDGPQALLDLPVFTIKTFDEAAALASEEPTPELAEALTLFKTLQGAKATDAVRSPVAQGTLKKILELVPNHLSAQLLLSAGQNRIPKQLTLAGSVGAIDQTIGRVKAAVDSDFSNASPLAAGEVGRVESALNALRPKLDPRTKEICDGWMTHLGIADDFLGGRVSRSQALTQLKSSGKLIDTAMDKFRSDPEVQEEMRE